MFSEKNVFRFKVPCKYRQSKGWSVKWKSLINWKKLVDFRKKMEKLWYTLNYWIVKAKLITTTITSICLRIFQYFVVLGLICFCTSLIQNREWELKWLLKRLFISVSDCFDNYIGRCFLRSRDLEFKSWKILYIYIFKITCSKSAVKTLCEFAEQ